MAFRLSDRDRAASQAAAAIRQANRAQADYDQRMGQAQSSMEAAQPKAVNPLESVLSGLASGAKGLWNAAAGTVNAVTGGIQTAAHDQDRKRTMEDASNKRNEIAKKYGYNSYSEAMNDDNASQDFWNEIKSANNSTAEELDKSKKEYTDSAVYKNLAGMSQNKYGADAIRGENFLADVLTAGGGSGLKMVGLNAVQGGLGGLADQLENTKDGEQFDWNEAGKRALSSAAGGAAGTLVGGKLGNVAGGGNLGKILGSNVGRGAIAGAASGAVSAGTQAALDGGSLEQVLGNAIDAGRSGALYGGLASGAMGLANRGFNKVSDAINKERTPNVVVQGEEPVVKTTSSDLVNDGETATGWGDRNMTGAAKKRNALQKVGDALQDTGQKTQDQAVIGKLKGNLADEMAAKNSVQRLRDIGFEPSDYDKAANLSEVANKWYDDQVKASKVKLDMPDTYKLADDAAYYRQLDADQAAKLKMDITKRLDAVRASGGGLSTFDAAGLERVAKGLGQDVEKMTTTNYGGSKKRINNLSANAEAYANALNDVKLALRSKVDDMTDYNPDSLRKVLADAGATQQQVDYLTDANSMAAVKRNTSLLEDARNMNRQMKSSPLKRGANADNSTSLVTQTANSAGVGGLLKMVTEPVGKGVGAIEKGLGKAISNAGDIVAGNGGRILPENISDKITSGVNRFVNSAINTTNVANSQAGNLVGALTNAAQRGAIRQNAIDQSRAASDNVADQNTVEAARAAMDAAQTDYDNAMAQAQQAYNNASTASTGNGRLEQILNAMDLALAAGDVDSYSQLANLYQTAYKIYAPATEASSTSSLNATQQNNLAKLESAGTAIDQLEQLYNQAGGGQGRIGGKLAELGGALGFNSAASSYENAARGLINQIAAAVGKTDSLNTEGEVQRALDLVPKITDTPEEAQAKLQSLRSMLNANKQTYQNIYGVAQ